MELPKWVNLGSWPYNLNLNLNEFVPEKDFWSFLKFKIDEKNKSTAKFEQIIIHRGKSNPEECRLELPANWS